MIFFYIYLISSILLTYLIATNTHKFAIKIKLIDDPKNSTIKIHKKTTPKIGGVIILILSLNYFFYNLGFEEIHKPSSSIFLFFFYFFMVGLLDDYLNISPLIRIILYSLGIYVMSKINQDLLIFNFYLETLNVKVIFNELALIFSIFCILTLLNSLNMFDGLNGSLIIYSICVLLILFLISFNIFILIILAALFICLYLNLKNKTFLGNSGSSIISSIIAYLIIDASKNFETYLSAEHIIIIFFIPGIDLVRLFVERIFNKKNPFYGDLNHFHHIVMKKNKDIVWISCLVIFIFLSYGISIFIEPIIVLVLSTILYFMLIAKYKRL